MHVQFTWLGAAMLSLALSACTPPQPVAEAPSAPEQAAPSVPVRSRGVVHAVTPEYNAITIQHEAIPEYDMPAMVMEFTVDNPSQLEGLAAGDSVTFELRSGLDISTISEEARY
jgi:Cu(I)/Ag(I) efflux system periplasmic protein CusF